MRTVLPFRALTVAFACILGLAMFPLSLQAKEVDMKRYITLTVKKGATIWLDLSGFEDDTPVRIVSGKTDITFTVDYDEGGYIGYVGGFRREIGAGASTMTIYGKVKHFDCSRNDENVTALDVSHNDVLTWLFCYMNRLTSLDVSRNTMLEGLLGNSNRLTSLDVSHNPELKALDCANNRITALDLRNNPNLSILFCFTNLLTSLDVSRNTMLESLLCHNNQITSLNLRHNQALAQLHCSNNRITSLDVSHNSELQTLDCAENQLTALDVSKNSQLTVALCWGNRLSTDAWNRFFCSLPDRSYMPNEQIIYPLDNRSYSQKPQVLAANGNIAKRKGWEVSYYNDGQDTPITGFTGSYRCTKTYK